MLYPTTLALCVLSNHSHRSQSLLLLQPYLKPGEGALRAIVGAVLLGQNTLFILNLATYGEVDVFESHILRMISGVGSGGHYNK